MLSLKTVVRRTSSALLMLALLASPGALARQPELLGALSAQVTAMSATGLTLAECQQRVQQMTGILAQAGYRSMRPYARGDTMIASWHGRQRDTTFLAISGTQASDNVFSVVEVPGLVHSNDFFGIQ
ncbi:hypothetical protein [Deinococcus marmoris]|uniref:hypothetical protein n=1 Tax=Deinococcus marmoris TaxID=249408 RepID=UPI0004983308|nr:hypothetical protein [Deinococcus marmoris]